MLKTLKRLFVGDKEFYKMILSVAIPIMIQSAITNFVGMLDNIMVGRVGTEQMTGVAISNQLIFIFYLTVFGAVAGAGIFGAQFFGNGDHKGVRYAFRFKVISSLLISAIFILGFILFGDELIMMYLKGEGDVTNIEASLYYGKQYTVIMLFSFVPYALMQCYASTLRESGETLIPMKAGIISMIVNFVLNAVLIFGLFGLPALGAAGAAIATVIARFVEFALVAVWTHRHSEMHPFIKGAFNSMHIPAKVTADIFKKAMPLIVNESLWSLSMALLSQCYSTRGYDVVSAVNIATTVNNVFNVAFIALGNSVGIIVGQMLGAGENDEALSSARKMIAFSSAVCFIFGGALAAVAPFFPMIYNTDDGVRSLATSLILIMAVTMPIHAISHGCYFTLRSGGRTFITVLFDSVYASAIVYPIACALCYLTNIPIIPLYFICQFLEIGKCIMGGIMVEKRIWIRNIVADKKEA